MKDLTKVVTGQNTRFSYANVWEPRKFKGDRAKYSICLIIPKEDGETLAKVEQAIAEAYRQGQETGKAHRDRWENSAPLKPDSSAS